MNNNSPGAKALMALVTLALAAYFGVQVFSYFDDPLSTTLAYTYQVEDTVSLSGYVVRSERVLSERSGELLRLQREEGERVSAGGVVAAVYTDQASLDIQMEIAALETRIEQLQYAQKAETGVEVAQRLDEQIRQSILDYRAALEAGRLNDAEKQGSDLRAQVLKRDYTNSDTESLTLQIQALQAQRDALAAQAAGSVRRITAPVSGLFSAVVDGYESVLTPESLSEMTPSQLSAVKAGDTVSHVGKLVLGNDWYYAAVMSAKEAEALAETSGSLLLRFAKGVERDLEVSLDFVGPEEDGNVVAVFRGETYLSQLTLLRQQSAQVVISSTEGIRVPEEALRIVTETVTSEDGTTRETQTTGVYCVVGMEARFRPVVILYRGENFVLVQAAPPGEKETLRLRPGDEVIITAKNLYDGKILNVSR